MSSAITGPYPHRGRWRLIVAGFEGGKRTQKAFSYPTREECERQITLARKREAKAEGVTVGAVVERFLAWQANRVSTGTVTTNGHRLRALLRLPTLTSRDREDYPLSLVDVGEAKRLYARRVTETKGDTHQAELHVARQCWDYAIDNRLCPLTRRNPWLEVEPEGHRARGKTKLRISDARHFVEHALAEKSAAGVAVATQLILGLRSTEVTSRQVRDLDDEGRVLWIPCAKTPAGVRAMGIPEILRAPLLELCIGHLPLEPLFGMTASHRKKSHPVDRQWIRHHMQRICTACRIPVVTNHSLRGLHTDLALLNDVTPEVVARSLGHVSFAVTAKHYAQPGTVETISAKRVSSRLTQK